MNIELGHHTNVLFNGEVTRAYLVNGYKYFVSTEKSTVTVVVDGKNFRHLQHKMIHSTTVQYYMEYNNVRAVNATTVL